MALLPRPRVPFIPAEPYARGLAWLERNGFAREALLDGTEIDVAELERPDGLLRLNHVEAFVHNTANVVGRPLSALEFGSGLLLPSHGVLGIAALTAPDLDGAIRTAETYLELITPLFVLERDPEETVVAFQVRPRYRMEPTVLGVHLRVVASSLSVAAKHGVGRVPDGVIVDLPEDQQELMEWLRELGVAVREGGEYVTLRIPRETLATPFVMGDERAHASAIARCEETLNARRPTEKTIRDVRRVLRDEGPPFPNLETTSRRIGVSSRTLRRRLAAEGSGFGELLEEARRSLASRLLVRSDRDITAIAYDLGYSTPATFSRAFGRALGLTPSAYRREHSGR